MPTEVRLVILNVSTPLLVILLGMSCRILCRFTWLCRVLPDRWFDWLTLIGSIVCLALSVLLVLASPVTPPYYSVSMPLIGSVDLLVDPLSVYFLFVVNVIAMFAAWNELASGRETPRRFRFNFLVNLFHFTMLLVPVIDNLILLWIAVEATTLVSTLLVSFLDQRNSWEAAWKYLLVTSTGIIFGLFGTMFLANAAQSLTVEGNPNQLMNWSFLMQNTAHLSHEFIMLSFLFILVGYGTKAGFAPMHTWLPDGHGEAPAPISALLSGVLLKSALYAILRFSTLTNKTLGSADFTSRLLLGAGLISLVLATPFILNERNRFKRVLAYHSLEHMGIIAFGLGIGGPIALFGALLHTLNHALTKALMFLSIGAVIDRFARIPIDQKGISNVLVRMPVTGVILAVGGLALVGMPPFNIFLSELIILWGALKPPDEPDVSAGPSWLIAVVVALFVISTTLIFYGLIRHMARVLLVSPTQNPSATGAQAVVPAESTPLKETWKEAIPLVLMALIVVLSGLVIWEPLVAVLDQSVAVLQYK